MTWFFIMFLFSTPYHSQEGRFVSLAECHKARHELIIEQTETPKALMPSGCYCIGHDCPSFKKGD